MRIYELYFIRCEPTFTFDSFFNPLTPFYIKTQQWGAALPLRLKKKREGVAVQKMIWFHNAK